MTQKVREYSRSALENIPENSSTSLENARTAHDWYISSKDRLSEEQREAQY